MDLSLVLAQGEEPALSSHSSHSGESLKSWALGGPSAFGVTPGTRLLPDPLCTLQCKMNTAHLCPTPREPLEGHCLLCSQKGPSQSPSHHSQELSRASGTSRQVQWDGKKQSPPPALCQVVVRALLALLSVRGLRLQPGSASSSVTRLPPVQSQPEGVPHSLHIVENVVSTQGYQPIKLPGLIGKVHHAIGGV